MAATGLSLKLALHEAMRDNPALVRLRNLRQLKLDRDLTPYEARERNEVAAGVSRSFYRALAADRRAAICEGAKKRWAALLEQARKRFADGLCPQMEVDEVQANLADAEANCILAHSERQIAHEELAADMGVDAVDSLMPQSPDDVAAPNSVELDVATALQHADLIPLSLQTVGLAPTKQAVEEYTERNSEEVTFFLIPVSKKQIPPGAATHLIEAAAAEHQMLVQTVRFRVTRDHQRLEALARAQAVVSTECAAEATVMERAEARYQANLGNVNEVCIALSQWVEAEQHHSQLLMDQALARTSLLYDTVTLVPLSSPTPPSPPKPVPPPRPAVPVRLPGER
ncbi:MAG: TolC family protein [Candidatus Xenobia bacterium]